MENDDVTVVISERSGANLRDVQERQLTDHKFRYGRSNTISQIQLKKDRARFAKWLAGASGPTEKQFSKDDFLMEISATKALDCFQTSAEDRGKKEQVRIIDLNKTKAQQNEEERLSIENLHHPETRMEIFFKKALTMCAPEQKSVITDSLSDFGTIPEESSVIYELTRLEREKDAALVRAGQVAWDHVDGNPFKQSRSVFERMWVLVSEDNPVWKVCCSIFLEFLEEAKKNHQQVSACMNCATVFLPFFPDDYHMHKRSAEFKTCVGPRSARVDWKIISQKALVDLAKEAQAYKKEGGDEYVKLIRIVKGVRGHRANVKYDRIELCENSSVEYCETTSEKKFNVRNLAVGMLKIVVQLHLKVPISSRLVKPVHHAAGLADYFQRYRHFVPEFSEETLFRCFLIEFGQHVRRTIRFDPDFQLNSNWWSGRRNSPDSAFLLTGNPGFLVKLDKAGLVQLAKSLAEGTLRVLDDFCRENKNSDFLSRSVVREDAELLDYLGQMPPWVEDEPVEKGLVPSLHPLCLATSPEVRDAEMSNKISETKLKKRAPDLDESLVREMERKRKNKADSRARKRALAAQRKFYSHRRKIMLGEVEP